MFHFKITVVYIVWLIRPIDSPDLK